MSFPQPPFQTAIQTAASNVAVIWQNWLARVQITLGLLTNSGPTAGRPTDNLYVGVPYFDTDLDTTVVWNGSTWQSNAVNINVEAPLVSSGGNNPTISITEASATTDGYLSSADWNTFNNKISTISATGVLYGNTGGSVTSASPGQIVNAIGKQYVQNASNALVSASATQSTYANNLSGGATNDIAYQTNTNATGFIAAPSTANTVLSWTGSSFSWNAIKSLQDGSAQIFYNAGISSWQISPGLYCAGPLTVSSIAQFDSEITVAGNLVAYSNIYATSLASGSTGNAMKWDSGTGLIQQTTSSIRYKTNIEDAWYGLSDALKLRPITFYEKKNPDGLRFGGFIAEEVDAAGLKEFVVYNKDGEPESLNYDNMVAIAIKAIQELNEKVERYAAEKRI